METYEESVELTRTFVKIESTNSCSTIWSEPVISPSSSTVHIIRSGHFKEISPFSRRLAVFLKVANAQASPDFISQLPLPYIRKIPFCSSISAPNGFFVHPSPTTTVSIWQININIGTSLYFSFILSSFVFSGHNVARRE